MNKNNQDKAIGNLFVVIWPVLPKENKTFQVELVQANITQEQLEAFMQEKSSRRDDMCTKVSDIKSHVYVDCHSRVISTIHKRLRIKSVTNTCFMRNNKIVRKRNITHYIVM